MNTKTEMPGVIRLCGRNVTMETSVSGPLNRSTQGLYSSWSASITLDSTLSEEATKATAVHEIVHDLDELVGTGLSEPQVTALASVLFATIRDNPVLMRWLMEESV